MRCGAIQVLRNAVGGERVSDFPEKSVTKMYGSTLLALRGGGFVSNFQKKTLEWLRPNGNMDSCDKVLIYSVACLGRISHVLSAGLDWKRISLSEYLEVGDVNISGCVTQLY